MKELYKYIIQLYKYIFKNVILMKFKLYCFNFIII